MANEVEPALWKAACAAMRRYFGEKKVSYSPVGKAIQGTIEAIYRTGWIMGYRAGQRSTQRKGLR